MAWLGGQLEKIRYVKAAPQANVNQSINRTYMVVCCSETKRPALAGFGPPTLFSARRIRASLASALDRFTCSWPGQVAARDPRLAASFSSASGARIPAARQLGNSHPF
jgi:hypothetical protein